MSAHTILEGIDFSLPEGSRTLDDLPTERGTREAERRWMGVDGLYITLSVFPAEKAPALDPLALDLPVGATLGRYCEDFEGTVHSLFRHEVDGAIAGRLARVSLRSVGGEPIELLLVGALTEDRHIVVLQVSWASAASEVLELAAVAVAQSLRLP